MYIVYLLFYYLNLFGGYMKETLKMKVKCHYYLDGQCLGWAGGRIGQPYPKCNNDYEYCMKG